MSGEYLESPDFWRSRVHPADLARIEKGYSRLFEEGHLSNEYRFRRRKMAIIVGSATICR